MFIVEFNRHVSVERTNIMEKAIKSAMERRMIIEDVAVIKLTRIETAGGGEIIHYVAGMIRDDNPIQAIRLIRDAFKVSLRLAKAIMEDIKTAVDRGDEPFRKIA